MPIINAVEVVATKCYIDKVMVNERELYWIKYYREKGFALLNKASIDTDGTHRVYSSYLASIKRGETSYHYYVCGKTIGGDEVYDEQRLNADGFLLKHTQNYYVVEQEHRHLKERRLKQAGEYVPPIKEDKAILRTVVFPEQPQWSMEFMASIEYRVGEPNDWEFEPAEDDDLENDTDIEPDCDFEPEYQ